MEPSTLLTKVVLLTLCLATVSGKQGYGPGEQDWGHVDVRPGAHMFYWLYYTTANVDSYTERPLAIWLQGGPGASSTGYGNFGELGPIDVNGNERNHTWVKDMNVLFIDNPVGTGFSYVDDVELLTTTNNEIALDLVSFMKGFYRLHPEFELVPLHIFSQSYGGKMAPEFALELYYANRFGEVHSNLKSVVLGSPWTSPIDSMMAWGPLLLNMGIVDEDGYESIMDVTYETQKLVKARQWAEAQERYERTQAILLEASDKVSFYDILKYSDDEDLLLNQLMRETVAKALNVSANVVWNDYNGIVAHYQKTDFMKPAVHIVSQLLDRTDLKVGVVTGQLDLICATAGTVNWIKQMQWSYKHAYEAAPRVTINVDGKVQGYEKTAGNFSMFWINRAGHSVPEDNPAGMSRVLEWVINKA